MGAKQLLDAGIHTAPLIDAKLCSNYVDQLATDPNWTTARVHYAQEAGIPGKLRPNMRRAEANGLCNMSDMILHMDERVRSIVLPSINHMYRTNHNTLGDHQAVRYEVGGEFKVHTDTGKNLEHRQFTVLCYLNDDIEGGETTFPDFGIAIKPKAGMAVTFPCEYRHSARPVVRGMKYVYLCWVIAAKPIKWL